MQNSMYVDMLDKYMTIKCRHPDCFGKQYPCNHLIMNKNEQCMVLKSCQNNLHKLLGTHQERLDELRKHNKNHIPIKRFNVGCCNNEK